MNHVGTGQAGGTRIAVNVTFLRMDQPPRDPAPPLPASDSIVTLSAPTTAFYRYLYATVGAPYCWWLRRVTPEDKLATLLADSGISLHVLYRDGEPGGFYELDARGGTDVNLAYFGLMPHLVGKGIGPAFLRAAVDAAWMLEPAYVRVNTCTADHPRALPTYLRAGFRPQRTVREVWDIPNALGLDIPSHLRV
jgi:GNAT superfamily N-acetyltransferase